MRLTIVLKYIGMALLLNAAFMVLAAGVSWISAGDTSSYALMLSAFLTAVIGAFPLIFVGKIDNQLSNKEGYVIVVGAWLMSCVAGMLPYLLWGGEFTLANAWYESVSGYTTTGSTILHDIDALPHGLLFWRSCTHWIGGAGVVMFALLVMPMMGRSRLMVSSVEMSKIAKEDYKYKSSTIIRILLTIYIGLSVSCFVLLKIAGMSWFDAANHAMSTAATGGFSTHNQSIAFFDSPLIETILLVFMVISGIHFGVIFATFTGKRNNLFRSEIVRYYLLFLACVSIAIAINTTLNGTFETFWESLRYSAFQTVSRATTTGFVASDSNVWGSFTVAILIFTGIQCACAGSTSGGLKADRIYLAVKVIRHQLRQQQHPNAIIRIKLNGVTQESSVLGYVMLFIVVYVLLLVVGTIFIAAFGYDVVTSFSLASVSLGNVGPSFGAVGGFDNMTYFHPVVRMFTTLLMLLGRLEIFGLLQLFLLKWWK
jgi:trk system potassium uptake protein TrkH